MPAWLKSLELHGYKTFASRTVFDFPSAVTAIVGPNGSGKSNIADAIRWVLGEQSYSLLRGKKTEDMIFAGSEQRSRAGMAAATVVFDNENHWLPIDFSEVAISRRAYRDGQNEYRLNGQRVRLKDVSEVLSQSGLSERTYTIIGQGLVDAALALKAEERRRLFEEAAGIGLHRSRKEEALRRLDLTLRNLERVQDILAELEPRLRGLERQARRAQEYERLKEELRSLLREWYGYHWHRGQQELGQARQLARQQERQLRIARNAQQNLDQQLNTFRAEIQELRERLNGWHAQAAGLHTRREAVSRDLAVAAERRRFLSEQELDYRGQLTGLEEQISLLQDRQEEARSEVDRLREDLEQAQHQSAAARQAHSERLQERQAAGQALEQARQQMAALEARQVELAARQAERRAQIARQLENQATTLQELETSQAACGLAEQERMARARSLEEAEQARKDAQELLASLLEEVSKIEASLHQLAEASTGHRTELARQEVRLQVLEQAEQTLTGYAEGARLLLEAARAKKVRGIKGALGARLDVPEGLETAIAAALGDYQDGIILEANEQADQALDILEQAPSRGALFPMNALASTRSLDFAASDGEVLGVAARLVEAPQELRQLIDLLLGRTLLVRDRQIAWQLVERFRHGGDAQQGLDVRVVTLHGEVFHASGAIQSGFENRAGLLSQKRMRKELQAEIAVQQERLRALESQAQETDSRLTGLRSKGEVLEGQLRFQASREEQARAALSQSLLTYEQATSQADWQAEQAERLASEQRRAQEELVEIDSDLTALKGELQAGRQLLEQCQQAFIAATIEDVLEQVRHWDLQAALAERALAEAQTRLDERQAALQESQVRKSSLMNRLEELSTQSGELEASQVSLRREESRVGEGLEELQQLIQPAEAELAEREAEQVRLQDQEAQARQSLNQAERFHAQAKINQARRQEALDALRRRIEDDFGLVSFDYADDVTGPNPLPLAGLVEQLPIVAELASETEEALTRQRALIRRMGPVNPEAQAEYREVKERYEFLVEQVGDLRKAEADIRAVVTELDELMEQEFKRTFDQVAGQFHAIFARLFGGGTARLVLTDPADLTTTGIDIEARLPGRREQGLSLLSGGERSLTAVALVFALLRVSPTPFCVLDEVDAMLDEANVGRFRDLLRELSQTTQFILITHNRNTVQVAEVIYGITMGPDSTSQMVSLKMDQVE